MIELLLDTLSVIGVLFLVGVAVVAWGLVVAHYHRRRVSATEGEAEQGAAVARTVHPNCRSTMVPLTVNGSGGTTPGQTITETWTSTMNASTTADASGPRGFAGPDLSDEEIEEWLREHGLSGYD